MLHEFIQPIIQFLHTHPHWGGVVAFTAAFIESLAVIGTIVPGSLTMTAIGVLIGTDILPAGATILWAVLGAYCGDVLSYWLGIYYNERLRRMWPFYKYPRLIDKGEAFFKLHGGKSIVIGRFTGPVRSLVPMIAGILGMRPLRFLPIALFTAFLWAIVYMLPGIILGALSLELPPAVATKFIALCLLLIVIVWGITWLIKFFFDQLWTQIDRSLIKLWNYLNIHKSSHWLTELLRNPQHEEDHQQLVRAVFAIIFGLGFLWILAEVLAKGWVTGLNIPVFNLLQSAHTNILDHFMIALSLLGDKHVLLITAAIVLIWFIWKRRWWIALHWFALIMISAVAIEFFKRLVYSPRPPIPFAPDHSSSFPSGHTLLSLTFFGFLAVLIADNVPNSQRNRLYSAAVIISLLIALSRLYLGGHWLTDTLASLFLGMVFLLLITLSYRRHTAKPFSAFNLFTVMSVTLFIAWIGFSYFNFKPLQQGYTANWPIQAVNQDDWWQQWPGLISLYRNSRTGYPSQPLNLQWLGSLDKIQQALTQQGWTAQSPKLDLENTISRLGLTKQKTHLPLIPLLYHNRAPKLFMTKQMNGEHMLMLRLWKSDVIIGDGQIPLWVGTINYYQPPEKLLARPKIEPAFSAAIDALPKDLKNFRYKLIVFSLLQQPYEMSLLQWDGKLLLIKNS